MQVIIATVAVLIALIVGITAVGRNHAEEKPEINPADRIYPVTYAVDHLAVWRDKGGEFDPAVLIALIKATVDPKSWDDPQTKIAPVEPAALVIATKANNHTDIRVLLERLRRSEPT